MKTLSEYIRESLVENVRAEHRIDEMARVSHPSDNLEDEVEIWVYGENDEQGAKTPHFHVMGEDFEFEVKIEHIHNLDIWRTKRIDKKSNAGTWNERSKIKKSILQWLDERNIRIPSITNAEVIVAQWSMNNPSNEIDNSFMK